jgi:hypothetical protein
MYRRGFAPRLQTAKLGPAKIVSAWIMGDLYIDALLQWIIIRLARWTSWFCGWSDRYILDGLVRATAWFFVQLSTLAWMADKHVLDGALGRLIRTAVAIVKRKRRRTRGMGAA